MQLGGVAGGLAKEATNCLFPCHHFNWGNVGRSALGGAVIGLTVGGIASFSGYSTEDLGDEVLPWQSGVMAYDSEQGGDDLVDLMDLMPYM